VYIEPENYTFKQNGDDVVVFNEMYEGATLPLIIVAILSILAPDAKDIHIPLAIEIKTKDSEGVFVRKDLSVTGALEYKRFIPESHYKKWRMSYLPVYLLLFLVLLAMGILLIYLSTLAEGGGRWIIFAISIVMIIVSCMFGARIYKQFALKKKYPVIKYDIAGFD
jgi:TM2 domain-containing membrane protein YozV